MRPPGPDDERSFHHEYDGDSGKGLFARIVWSPEDPNRAYTLSYRFQRHWSPDVFFINEVDIAFTDLVDGHMSTFHSWNWTRMGDVPDWIVFKEKQCRELLRTSIMRGYGNKVLMFILPSLELQRRRIETAQEAARRQAVVDAITYA